ncbi:DNA polymerase delta subunit 3-like [Galleria mellonella]|uniref:DNA polymerase delta subunit 3 n=1 Tax=Galleria mellonella TaxID=7137 RepID=A0A6J1X1Q7_GALME|nr:DNA polymerase delta subunit 3-like [Galleria mellonella]
MEGNRDTNLNTLKEMLLDEDRLITYVSLSKELCVHVNESKLLLNKIVDLIKKNHPTINLCVNYIISGLTDDNKAFTKICTDAEIDGIKKSSKLIFFQHIYSVAKGQPTVDNMAYTAINKIEDFLLCTGFIRSNLCIKRTVNEIGNLKSSSQEIATHTKPVIPVKKVKEEKDTKTEIGEPSIDIVQKSKPDPTIKQDNMSKKMDSRNHNKSQKSIAGFFNKTDVHHKNDNYKNASNAIKMENGNKPNISIKVEEVDVKYDIDVEMEDVKNDYEEKNNGENKSKNKSITIVKKNAKVDKKRKRLLHVSDSESEDEKNDPFADDTSVTNRANAESDDEIPPTPALNTIKITSGIVNPKKRRKIVDKTYINEDGYILTKKEEIYESCSENEEVDIKENIQKVNEISPKKKQNNIVLNKKPDVSPNNKKIGAKVNRKKSSPPQKGKQQTLMNFFKKV